jgi:hypothetical protein
MFFGNLTTNSENNFLGQVQEAWELTLWLAVLKFNHVPGTLFGNKSWQLIVFPAN